jgi:hypothetical protein
MEKEYFRVTDDRNNGDIICRHSSGDIYRYIVGKKKWKFVDPVGYGYTDGKHIMECEDIAASGVDREIEKTEKYFRGVLELAVKIAFRAHEGQKDKEGKPYICHPMRIASRVEGTELKAVAWLHDVVEDTEEDFSSLRDAGIPNRTLARVLSMTREKGATYGEYLKRLSKDPDAVVVKLEDLHDNMDLSRLSEVTPKDLDRYNKYRYAAAYLMAPDRLSFLPDVIDKKDISL